MDKMIVELKYIGDDPQPYVKIDDVTRWLDMHAPKVHSKHARFAVETISKFLKEAKINGMMRK